MLYKIIKTYSDNGSLFDSSPPYSPSVRKEKMRTNEDGFI